MLKKIIPFLALIIVAVNAIAQPGNGKNISIKLSSIITYVQLGTKVLIKMQIELENYKQSCMFIF